MPDETTQPKTFPAGGDPPKTASPQVVDKSPPGRRTVEVVGPGGTRCIEREQLPAFRGKGFCTKQEYKDGKGTYFGRGESGPITKEEDVPKPRKVKQ